MNPRLFGFTPGDENLIAKAVHNCMLANPASLALISLVQFMAVAEHLNFRHAANALGVSQSSVSARVKALEKILVSCCSSAMREVSG